MEVGFVETQIRRGNRNLLILGLIMTAIGAGLVALLGRWFPGLLAIAGFTALCFWIRRTVNPAGHPLYKQLARYGDVAQVVDEVNREFAVVKQSGVALFGERWLAQPDTYGVSLVPWTDIAWIHKYTRVQNGLRSTFVRVWSRDGKQFVSPAGTLEEESDRLLKQFFQRAPWAEVGYSQELQRQWSKQRNEFLGRVEVRRSGAQYANDQAKAATDRRQTAAG